MSNTTYMYGGDFFQNLYDIYSPIHVAVTGVICGFGVLFNTLNIAVFSMRSMRSPTNVLLTGLSIAQLCLVTNYLLLLIFNITSDSCVWLALHTYSFVFYKWINVNLNVVFHSVATCLTLVLAVIRFLAVKAPNYARTRIHLRWSRLVIICIYSIIPFLCTPIFFMSYVAESESKRGICNLDIVYELDYTENTLLIEFAMWLFGVLFKLIPSSTIAILSLFLIRSLKKYHKKKARLASTPKRPPPKSTVMETMEFSDSLLVSQPTNQNHNRRPSTTAGRKQLTKMLLAVALLSVCVELPHGIINLLTAIFGQQFAREVYDNLGDIFEMLTLLYSSVNFVLYCLISIEYQNAFIFLLFSCLNKVPRVRKRVSHAL